MNKQASSTLHSNDLDTETELRKQLSDLQKLNAVLDEAQAVGRIGSWELDVQSNAMTWTNFQYELLKYPTRSPVNLNLFYGTIALEDREAFQMAVDEARLAPTHIPFEHEVITFDGRRISVISHIQSNADPATHRIHRIFGTCQDLTDYKQAERMIQEQQAQLYSSSKLASLGEMASGVAHEINNPLAVIGGKVHQIINKLTQPKVDMPKTIKDLETIAMMVDRIATIVKGLRTFSRDATHDPFVDAVAGELIEETLELCTEKIQAKGIQLKTQIAESAAKVMIACRPAQISQVLMNLLNNASDAVESLSEKWIELKADVVGEDLRIQITDSGNGIPSDLAQKIMDPFFTTKDVGRGTGLGLSIASSLAKDHGGLLSYDSTCPNTRFEFVIPVKSAKRKSVA